MFIVPEKAVHRGLAIGVTSMKAGESALFHVGWELGYGEEGNFSFPNVPPKADLIYEVDLIGFEDAKEVRLCYEVFVLMEAVICFEAFTDTDINLWCRESLARR